MIAFVATTIITSIIFAILYFDLRSEYKDIQEEKKRLIIKFSIQEKKAKNNESLLRTQINKLNKEKNEIAHEKDNLQATLNKTLSDSIADKENYHIKEKELINNHSITINNLKNDVEFYKTHQKQYEEFVKYCKSNRTAIPWMAQLIADYETYGLENLASSLDWGYDQQRLKKVKSIREIRKDAQAMVEKNKEAQYQLAYLLELYPSLQDVIDCEFKQLPLIRVEDLTEYDSTKDYLSKEEYNNLSTVERNQLALDRYISSHNKTKWQIGRDYELYIGYLFEKSGYTVDYFGSYMGLEDLGRDLIAKKKDKTLIVQCKYWSSSKQIHEKHITQLYGTMMCYCIENNISKESVVGYLITNISLSDTALQMADFLGIQYKQNIELKEFPRIKCKINRDEYGQKTKIYHLPFDQQYDTTKIKKEKGDFVAMTVEEAEKAGFRRAFKWFGQ